MEPISYRPPLCPQCGYSFETLPTTATCPECGLSYGPDHIILFAWRFRSNFARSSKFLILICLVGLFSQTFPMFPVFLLLLYQRGYKVIFAIHRNAWVLSLFLFQFIQFCFFAAIFILIIRRHFRRLRTMPAPLQIRLSPAGYAIRAGLGPVKIRPWKPTTTLTLKIQKNNQPKFTLRAKKRWFTERFFYPLISTDRVFYPLITTETATWIEARVKTWIASENPTDASNPKPQI